jgi:hypothetical protein
VADTRLEEHGWHVGGLYAIVGEVFQLRHQDKLEVAFDFVIQ